MRPRHRLAAAAAALVLCAVGPGATEHRLSVASVSLDATGARARYAAEFEFTEPDLNALRDDETAAEIRIVDRDGRGGRRLLENLEDCRMTDDGSFRCPGGFAFERVGKDPPRWRLAIAVHGPPPDGPFRPPVTIRFAYSVSGGEETVHVATIASCTPGAAGRRLECRPLTRASRRRPGTRRR